MRVLVVSNMYPSNRYPHYGIFVKNTAAILKKHGFYVDVSAMGKSEKKIKKIFSYSKFYLLTFLRLLVFHYDYVYVHYVSHSALPVVLAKKIKKSIQIIANVHGNDIVPECDHDVKMLKYSKKIMHMAGKIVCPSTYFKNILHHEYNIPENKMIVYPSGGVDLHMFFERDQREARKELGLSGKRYVGYVSRIEKDKGYDIFLKACQELSLKYDDLQFIVVGDGNEINHYNAIVRESGLEAKITKYSLLSQQKLAVIYNALDVFVFPTYRKSESLGLVGIEAMACGTLTVLPDRYGPTSYGIDGKNCFMFQSGNAKSLMEQIDKALNYEKKNEICINAKKTAAEYSGKQLEDLLLTCFQV